LVVQPFNPEVLIPEPEVADVESFVLPVSSGTHDAEVAAAAVGILRATTGHLRVVSDQLRPGVVEPRIQLPAAAVSQDPAVPLRLIQEPKDVALGLHLFGVEDGCCGGDLRSSRVCKDEQSGR
jgi:hypothetical protein